MPIYEYKRPDGTTFEIQQSFDEEAFTVDPESGVPVKRVLHAPAVHFKGKGFYNTDYGTRKRQRESAEHSSAEKHGEQKSSGAESSPSDNGASGPSPKVDKVQAKPKDSKSAPAS